MASTSTFFEVSANSSSDSFEALLDAAMTSTSLKALTIESSSILIVLLDAVLHSSEAFTDSSTDLLTFNSKSSLASSSTSSASIEVETCTFSISPISRMVLSASPSFVSFLTSLVDFSPLPEGFKGLVIGFAVLAGTSFDKSTILVPSALATSFSEIPSVGRTTAATTATF